MSGHENRTRWIDAWADGIGRGDILDIFFEAAPEAVFALLVTFTVVMSLYAYTGSLLTAAILMTLLGGTILMALPPQAAMVGSIMTTLALATALFAIWKGR